MNLKPLYRNGNVVLIGLAEDYQNEVVQDGLALEIDIHGKRIVNNPWSGQKKLKFGYYDPISNKDIPEVIKEIKSTFNENVIKEMEDLLLNPTREAIDSLIWIPNRLR